MAAIHESRGIDQESSRPFTLILLYNFGIRVVLIIILPYYCVVKLSCSCISPKTEKNRYLSACQIILPSIIECGRARI